MKGDDTERTSPGAEPLFLSPRGGGRGGRGGSLTKICMLIRDVNGAGSLVKRVESN
jgi:hypothetical protein